MSSPSSDPHAQIKKTKRVRGVPPRPTASSVSSSPAGAQSLSSTLERYISPRPVAELIGDEANFALATPIVDESPSTISAMKPSVLDEEVEDVPQSVQHAVTPRRTDSVSLRNPAKANMVKSVSPVPPEWTSTPPWPTRPEIVDTRLMDGPPPQMYAIYGPSDLSVGSDLNTIHASIGEVAAPRRISAADALGSIVSGKHQLSAASDRPNLSNFPGRQQAGVYVHSFPSASEPEPPSSPSDSDYSPPFPPRTVVDPPGHTSSPVLAKPLTTSSHKAGAALEAVSHRMRRNAPTQGPKQMLEPDTTRTHEQVDRRSSNFPPNLSDSPRSDDILWARWDSLDRRRLLIMGYHGGGIQIWDVTDLDAVHEVLHLTDIFARSHPRTGHLLPAPPLSIHGDTSDVFASSRPLLGVLLRTAELVLYSLGHHNVAKRVMFLPTSERAISDCDMQVSELFVVVSTLSASHDVSVHVLSAYDLSSLHVIRLSPGTALPPLSLSRRLLAVPLQPPSPSLKRLSRPATLQSGIAALKESVGLAGSMKMEVATTVRGVWSGMSAAASSAWGGLIANAVPQESSSTTSKWSFSRSAPTPGTAGSRTSGEWHPSSPGGVSALKAPPTAAADPRSHHHLASEGESLISATQNSESVRPRWIAVYDLYPLLGMQSPTSPPLLMAHFPLALTSNTPTLSSSTVISALSFSPSGALLAAGDGDGAVVKVFQLRWSGVAQRRDPPPPVVSSPRPPRPPSLPPSPNDSYSSPPSVHGSSSASRPRRRSSASSVSRPTVVAVHNAVRGDRGGVPHIRSSGQHRNVWHVYDLVRGVTRAKVEGVGWAHDERWVGVSTAAGTLHIFATNPYGGVTDEDSHVDGRVRNVTDFQPLSTALSSIARIHVRASGSPASSPRPGYHRGSGPLISFVFPTLSTSLHSMFSPRNVSPPPSTANFPASASLSPTRRPITGFQDILLTVPSTGRLELHRTNVIPSPKILEPPPTTLSTNAPPRASPTKPSISLPSSGLTHMMKAVRSNTTSGLRAHHSPKATWDIRKDREWEDVEGEFLDEKDPVYPSSERDWLSEAELSTSTTSLSMLPDSVYLSHQFSFYSFADDWQAPLLRSVFELPCTKIEVRKEVEISPFPSSTTTSKRRNRGDAESFVQGNAHVGSPFDEPLASAIQARLDPPSSEPGVIPSYPNGLHAGPNSWRDATVPLRHAAVGISDGVGEGLKQLRRELVKVAKSPSKNNSVRAPTTLTFDERDAVDAADADNLGHHTHSTAEESSGGSESTLSTSNVEPPDMLEEWREAEVADDVAEYEAFESLGLGIVGEMDEDQPIRRPDSTQLVNSKTTPQSGRRRHEL